MRKVLLFTIVLFAFVSCRQQEQLIRSTETNINPVRLVSKNSHFPPGTLESSTIDEGKVELFDEYNLNSIDSTKPEVSENLLVTNEVFKRGKHRASQLNSFVKKNENNLRASRINSEKLASFHEKKPIHWASTLSLVMGVLGLVILPILGNIAAIVFGIVALNKIKAENSNYSGKDMAIAGLVIGVIGLLIYSLAIALLLAMGGW